ncbi:MAG: hypothetical protein KQJ78_23100 [Deltaproteobacteria bacterium]|nr:hypothetical protein [Deltaproteobacteria bacterium]
MQDLTCKCGRGLVLYRADGQSMGKCRECYRDMGLKNGEKLAARVRAVRSWQSWDDVPLIMQTAEVCEFLQMDRRTLDKQAQAGHLKRGAIGRGNLRYGRAALREFCREANCDPFEV